MKNKSIENIKKAEELLTQFIDKYNSAIEIDKDIIKCLETNIVKMLKIWESEKLPFSYTYDDLTKVLENHPNSDEVLFGLNSLFSRVFTTDDKLNRFKSISISKSKKANTKRTYIWFVNFEFFNKDGNVVWYDYHNVDSVQVLMIIYTIIKTHIEMVLTTAESTEE